jgi:hypothetical protein
MTKEHSDKLTPPEGYANDFYRTVQEAWHQLVELENLLWMYGPPDDPRGVIHGKVDEIFIISQRVERSFEPVTKEKL